MGIVAICLRNGLSELEQEPDLLFRALIAREGACHYLRSRAQFPVGDTGPFAHAHADEYALRELAYTFGNQGLVSPEDYRELERHFHQYQRIENNNVIHELGLPEPADHTTPPWADASEIGSRQPTGADRPERDGQK